jgi:hypothetical protein
MRAISGMTRWVRSLRGTFNAVGWVLELLGIVARR